MIQGQYKFRYWPSVQILRHLSLVLIFVFFDFIMLRLYAMGIVLMVFLILLIFKQPYKDNVMNWLDISLSSLLIILDVISISDTLQIYHIPMTGGRIKLDVFFQYLKIIILLLPPVLLGIYMIIDKCRPRKKKLNNKKNK